MLTTQPCAWSMRLCVGWGDKGWELLWTSPYYPHPETLSTITPYMAFSSPDPHQLTPCIAFWSPDSHSWPYNWPHTLPYGLELRLAWGGNWWSWIQTLKQWDLFHSLLQKIMCNYVCLNTWVCTITYELQCVLLVQVQITRYLNNKTSPLNSGGLWHSGQSRQWWSQSHCWDNNRTNSHVQLQHRLQPCGKQYSDL